MRIVRRFKSFLNRLPVGKKLAWSTALITLIPSVVLFTVIVFVFVRTNTENACRQAQATLDKTTGELSLWVSQARERLHALAVDINMQQAIRTMPEVSYKEQLELRDSIHNQLATMYTSDMKVLRVSVYITEMGKTFSGDRFDYDLRAAYGSETWFNEFLSGTRTAYCGHGLSMVAKKPALFLASGIVNIQSGELLGIVCVELDESKIYETMEELVRGTNDSVVVGSKIISDGESATYSPVSVQSSVLEMDLDVEYRLSLEELRTSTQIVIVWLSIGLVCMVRLLWLFSGRFSIWVSSRIVRICEGMRQISNGNLDIIVEDPCKDELGELANDLTGMARDMKSLIEKNYLAELENQKATLHALQHQMNPHFVYNTLEAISMLALLRDNYEIVDIAQAFAGMMRYSVMPRVLVRMEDEVENIQQYIVIQKIRLSGGVEVEWCIGEDCRTCRIPRLSLQPLVENAFKHGFENTFGEKRLVISVRHRGCWLCVRVYDTGAGIPPERLREIRRLLGQSTLDEVADCLALRNLSQRLVLLYGGGARLGITSRVGKGTLCTLRVPFEQEENGYEEGFDLR